MLDGILDWGRGGHSALSASDYTPETYPGVTERFYSTRILGKKSEILSKGGY
jgi:hypothetical protein